MKRQENGVTLAELLVGVAVIALLLATAFSMLQTSWKVADYETKKQFASQQRDKALWAIEADLKNATQVDVFGVDEQGRGNEVCCIVNDQPVRLYCVTAAGAKGGTLYRNTAALTDNCIEELRFSKNGQSVEVSLAVSNPNGSSAASAGVLTARLKVYGNNIGR